MTVIGTTQDGLILQASHDEVAQLIGYHGRYSAGHTKLRAGDTVRVAAMYGYLHDLRMHANDLAAMAAKARAAADLLDTLPDPVVVVKVGPDETGAEVAASDA